MHDVIHRSASTEGRRGGPLYLYVASCVRALSWQQLDTPAMCLGVKGACHAGGPLCPNRVSGCEGTVVKVLRAFPVEYGASSA